ncbi:conserved hypothetical protein [uncultured Desulfobacterium sp.]|uniref:Fe/B12 periplasmic-binding domain-containing protein n=1 Tax=uncultured Desulfobacterium sp. TaxID=201089 RepID=A0A445MQK5_9BACT|nr:conserved hypothetical protein [uncultured Desulfobacterium sp.]
MQQIAKVILFIIVMTLISLPLYAECRNFKDQLGRQVVIQDSPQRIISLAPSITEIVYALGEGHRLKGVTQYSDFPPEAKHLPVVGSFVNMDVEKVIVLRPDLCIAVRDGNSRDDVKNLEALKVPVYAVNPMSLDSVMNTVLDVGDLLDVSDKAEAIVADMRTRIGRVDALISTTAHRPRVFFQIGIAPIVSVGTNTFANELIARAGGINLASGPIPYPRYSREQVLALSPEVFIISSMERGEVFERVKAEWSRWKDIPAVRDNRICLADSNILDRPTPRAVDGLELLARIIHPEIFGPEIGGNKQ